MFIKLDTVKLRKRIFKQFNFQTISDQKKFKNKLDKQDPIFKISFSYIFLIKSQFDYNFEQFDFKNQNTIKSVNRSKDLFYLKFYKKIFSKAFYFVRKYFHRFYFSYKKKDYQKIHTVIISKHKYIDEINFINISKKLKKKQLIFFNDLKKKIELGNFYNNKIEKFFLDINIFDFLKGYFFYIKKKKYLLDNYPIKNVDKIQISNFYKRFFIELEFYKRSFKNLEPKKIICSSFVGNEALLFYFKYLRKTKTKFISYSIHGLGGESSNYFYYLSDLLLVPEKIDKKIRQTCLSNKINLLRLPPLAIVGSVRHKYWLKNKTNLNQIIKNKKKIFTILFICSNPVYFKRNFEKKSLNYLLKFAKRNNDILFLIKQRPIFKNYINQIRMDNIVLIDKNNFFIEDLIHISDLCIGTSSSGIVRQATLFDKNVLQLFHNESYMAKLNQNYEVNSYQKFEKILNAIIKNKKHFKYYSKQFNYKRIDPVKNIVNILND